jgi:hypothetical protein
MMQGQGGALYNQVQINVPVLTNLPHIPSGELSSDNSYRHAKLSYIQ